MVWGSMSYSGVGVMTVIDDIMTKEVYVRLLKENLDKSVKKQDLEEDISISKTKIQNIHLTWRRIILKRRRLTYFLGPHNHPISTRLTICGPT